MSKKNPQAEVDVIWRKKINEKAFKLNNEYAKSGLAISALNYVEQQVAKAIETSFEKNPVLIDDSLSDALMVALEAHLPFLVKGAFRMAKIENDKQVKTAEGVETKDRAVKSKAVIDAIIYEGMESDSLLDNKFLLKTALRAKLDTILRELVQQNINTLITQMSMAITGLQREALEKLWGKDEYNVTLLDVLAVRSGREEAKE